MQLAASGFICIVCTLLGACAPPPSSGQDLQRHCHQSAAAWFQAQHPDGITRETVDQAIHTEQYSYSDHFNPQLKRCFVIASEEKSTVYPDRPSLGVSGKSLRNLEDQVQLGQVVSPWPAAPGALQNCSIGSKHCASMREWEELAAPYMER